VPQDEWISNNKKAIPLQALTGPEGSRRLRLPDFKILRQSAHEVITGKNMQGTVRGLF
jgi:hypothetical protein